jgi:O-antigen/teichoic acid export membrane protein
MTIHWKSTYRAHPLMTYLRKDSFGVSVSAVIAVASSALSTLIVAKTCGPSVRGVLATGFLWLAVAQCLGFRGANVIAAKSILSASDPGVEEKTTNLHQRVVLDVPLMSTVVFFILMISGRLGILESLVFSASSISLARINWTAVVLQSRSSLKPLAKYRIVANGVPQIAQLVPIFFGMRSVLPICLAFLVGNIAGHRFGIWTTGLSRESLDPKHSFRSLFRNRASLGTRNEAWSLTVSALLQAIAPRMDLVFLTAISSSVAIGRYSLAASVTAACSAFSYVLIVNSFRHGALGIRWSGKDYLGLLILALIAVLGFLACRFGLLRLMGTQFSESVTPAGLLCLGTFPVGVGAVLTERWRGQGRAHYGLAAQILSLATTTFLLLVFARDLNLTKVALMTLISQTLVAICVSIWFIWESNFSASRVTN